MIRKSFKIAVQCLSFTKFENIKECMHACQLNIYHFFLYKLVNVKTFLLKHLHSTKIVEKKLNKCTIIPIYSNLISNSQSIKYAKKQLCNSKHVTKNSQLCNGTYIKVQFNSNPVISFLVLDYFTI